MNTLDVEAEAKNLPQVLRFIDESLEAMGLDHRVQTQIDVAAEEIFANISSYAYQPEKGQARIQVEKKGNPPAAAIVFSDRGTPYNPLEKPDPNLNVPVRERKKGGLGIYMVKKSMDEVIYEYRDGQNVLTIIKYIG